MPDSPVRKDRLRRCGTPDVEQTAIVHYPKGMDVKRFLKRVGAIGIASQGKLDSMPQQQSKVFRIQCVLLLPLLWIVLLSCARECGHNVRSTECGQSCICRRNFEIGQRMLF